MNWTKPLTFMVAFFVIITMNSTVGFAQQPAVTDSKVMLSDNFSANASAENSVTSETQEMVSEMIRNLKEGKSSEATARILVRIGKPAVPQMVAVLSERRSSVNVNLYRLLIWALGQIGVKGGIVNPPLPNLFTGSNNDVRIEIVRALPKISPDNAVAMQVLVLAMRNNDIGVRIAGAETAGAYGILARSVIPKLSSLLITDDDVDVRKKAAEALGKMTPELISIVAPVLIEGLKGGTTQVRQACSNSLVGFGPSALPELERLSSQEDDRVKSSISEIISRIKSPSDSAVPVPQAR